MRLCPKNVCGQGEPTAGKGEDPRFMFLGPVSKPLSKRIQNAPLATISCHFWGGVHDLITYDPFSLNGQRWGHGGDQLVYFQTPGWITSRPFRPNALDINGLKK